MPPTIWGCQCTSSLDVTTVAPTPFALVSFAHVDGRDAFELLAELPDLWDLSVGRWPGDSATSRFREEGFQEPYVAFAKALTSKPVVGVGRFTSPDTMASQIGDYKGELHFPLT